ncbi:F-box/LRR-repeat protein 3 [Aplysia californica]|uniref:F-box/LRR-repeat protein 3 n=1 Tax=Aplysia californica TaxID=6500 RepID=A0ABM1ADV9_APLCA|nr:F-box/LRR-repeat protein 3 [Aplysia californica]XP_012945813.1 F-box/LRR-repeat protein 3 [Aplysia californica]
MGSTSSSLNENETPSSPPRKRARTSSPNRSLDQCRPYEKETRSQWQVLPYVALTEVYGHLPGRDKFNMALTCKTWREPFSRPALWRRASFRFNDVDDWRALCCVSRVASALRHVTVDCAASDIPADKSVGSADNLAYFFRCLVNAKNCRLTALNVTNMRRLARYLSRPDHDVVTLLTNLLEVQTQLDSLSLRGARLSPDHGLRLLVSAGLSSGSILSLLDVSDLFATTSPRHDMAANPRFLSVLTVFTNLSEIDLNHQYLSDDVMYIFSENLCGKLRKIRVLAHYMGRPERRTSPETWAHLCSRCPDLSADFSVKGVSEYRNACLVLTRATPLTCLGWTSGIHADSLTAMLCTEHIAHHFRGTLQNLTLDVCQSFLDDPEILAKLIERCTCLRKVSVQCGGLSMSAEMRLELAIRRVSKGRVPDAVTPPSAPPTETPPDTPTDTPTAGLEIWLNGRKVDLDKKWPLSLTAVWLMETLEAFTEQWSR